MLEDERPGLFAMTFGAALVETRHRQSASGFENVQPVRIVALHAIQATFDDGVMLGQIELGMSFEMALEASGRIFSRIDNKLTAATTRFNVLAARPVA